MNVCNFFQCHHFVFTQLIYCDVIFNLHFIKIMLIVNCNLKILLFFAENSNISLKIGIAQLYAVSPKLQCIK